MEILNIIDKIYESKYFTTVLISSVIVLAVLFIAVLILGMKDAKRLKNPKKKTEEDVKDITFNNKIELENIKEDVTFEMPALTKNLEEFKKSLEEEIQREENDIVVKQNKVEEEKEIKPVKILEINEIEDTSILDLTGTKPEESAEK